MPLKVLVVPDKFKGTLTARAAAECIAQGWRQVRPADTLELLPMSDGGDGFGEVLANLLPVQARATRTVDAAHRPCEATWWWEATAKTAIIESARVIGLALLPPKHFHPFELDTFGLGAVLQAAADPSTNCLVGIGGSATNDGGFGLARALGWTFLTATGDPITSWTDLANLIQVKPPRGHPDQREIVVAVDVQNPLLGDRGASRIYGPQKGLRPEDFPKAEACLGRLAEVLKVQLGMDAAAEPGTGAAGGLGFGLRCFLDARLESGFALFARYARLEERIASSDLVLTGEGAIDSSTLMGKGVGEIAQLCRRHGIPCLGLAGSLSPLPPAEQDRNPFTRLYGIVPELTSPEAAQHQATAWLPRLAAQIARESKW